MRFAIALVTLIAAAALVVGGVAQRTFLRPPDSVQVAATVPAGVDYLVVPAEVLRAHPGQQRLHVAGTGTAFAAYARTTDIVAWLAGQRYARLTLGDDGRLGAPQVLTAPRIEGFAGGGSPDPDGSDLWLDQRLGQKSLDWTVSTPRSVSVLIAADGRTAVPSQVRITWPTRQPTPTAVPLIVAGAVLAVVGLLLYIWALVHLRRHRGPRRKPPAKLPRRPAPPRFRPQHPVATGPGRGRRSVRAQGVRGMTSAVAIGVVAAVAIGVGGPAHPAAASEPTPAVSEDQAHRIVQRIAATAAAADAKLDAGLAATRFAGPALELRSAAYRVRARSKKASLPQPIPGAGAVTRLVLPEATSSWPRTLFVVLADPAAATTPPLALAMVQDDPRAPYRVHYAMSLQPSAKLPDLPSALRGGKRLDALTAVLKVPPAELGTDYGMLLRDSTSTGAKVFDTADDRLAKGVGEQAKRKAARQLGSTAGITFGDRAVDPASVIAMSTADAGALVAVDLDELWTVKPKRSGVTVKPPVSVRALAGIASTSKGIRSVYGYQLLFAVPSAGSSEPVVLLGYAQGLVSAKEL